MYFWNIELLKKKLINQGLTETQLYYYILIYAALSAIGMEMMLYFPHESPNSWDYIGSILNIAITILGTVVIFRANGGASGVQFAARYFSVMLVASIRFMALLFPLVAVLMIYWVSSNGSGSETSTTIAETALFAAWYALLYAYIAKHIRDIARA